jgi:hypothetical protein
MLFAWDGQSARGIGGTAESVAEARERGLPLRVIDAATLQASPLEGGRPLPWRDEVLAKLPAAPSLERLFAELDLRAVKGAPRSRWFAAGSITLNQMATLIYGVLVAFGLGVEAAPVVKFVIVVVAACAAAAALRGGLVRCLCGLPAQRRVADDRPARILAGRKGAVSVRAAGRADRLPFK